MLSLFPKKKDYYSSSRPIGTEINILVL